MIYRKRKEVGSKASCDNCVFKCWITFNGENQFPICTYGIDKERFYISDENILPKTKICDSWEHK